MSKKNKCYCAFCRNPRTISHKKHLGFRDFLLTVVMSGCLSLIFWQGLDPKALVLVLLFSIGLEIVIQFYWRLQLQCPYCGFDPFLYKKNPKRAAEKVIAYWDQQKQEPLYHLRAHLYAKIPFKKWNPKDEAKPESALQDLSAAAEKMLSPKDSKVSALDLGEPKKDPK